MRTFKFRAWHEKAKKMLYETNPGDVFHWKFEGQPIIIMQCSGFKDMNKKDIYEGDIIKTRDGRCIIEWSENQKIQGKCRAAFLARAFRPLIGLTVLGGYHYPKEIEVIGNIYESPNLISPKRA